MSATREDDPMVFYHRAMLVKNRVEQLLSEAQGVTDPGRLAAVAAEVKVCEQSLYALREEQLLDQMKPRPRVRPWWRRLLGTKHELSADGK